MPGLGVGGGRGALVIEVTRSGPGRLVCEPTSRGPGGPAGPCPKAGCGAPAGGSRPRRLARSRPARWWAVRRWKESSPGSRFFSVSHSDAVRIGSPVGPVRGSELFFSHSDLLNSVFRSAVIPHPPRRCWGSLWRLQQHQFIARGAKCSFSQPEINFFGLSVLCCRKCSRRY